MNSLMNGGQSLPHWCQQCHNKPQKPRPRHLHESSLNLGETPPLYITTHNQSYSGRSADGRPLVFRRRDPSFPSQHRTRLDLSNITPLQCPRLSHTQEVHRPKHITPRASLNMETWTRYKSGQSVREIVNPQGVSEHWPVHKTHHRPPVSSVLPQLAGKPIQWHHHDILTGEQRQTAGPGRQARDRLLRAKRKGETDCPTPSLH